MGGAVSLNPSSNDRTTELCALGNIYLASGGPDGTVCVWHTLSGECLWTLVGHAAIVWSLSAMPDQKLACEIFKSTPPP
jgi:WD40 repeat protein